MTRTVNLTQMPHLNAGLKVAWAKKHLDAFNAEVGRFLLGKTHTVFTEDDLESSQYILHIDAAPLNVELGLIAGDFLSCLRASLDHLACQLTRTPKGRWNEKASFPVIPIRNTKGQKLFKDSVIGIPKEAIALIELLQPYHSGDAYKITKLWKLHRLWNIDKHRRIPLYAAAVQVPVTFPTDMPPISDGSDNSGVMRFPLAAKPYVNFDPMVKVNVYLGDEAEGIIVSAQELFEIYKFVRYDVIPQFKSFFESGEVIG